MVYEYRDNKDYFYGTLQNAASISDTTLTATIFTGLSTVYTTAQYLPLVLHNPATPVREVVWVTAHSAASSSVTVVRAREGSVAAAWPAGTQIVCAPTAARDAGVGQPVVFSSLPTDPHVGLRVTTTDRVQCVEKTYTAGWQPSVGIGSYLDVGPAAGAVVPPVGSVMLMRGGVASGTSVASGVFAVTFRNPFPNGLICLTGNVVSSSSTISLGVHTSPGNATTGNFITYVGAVGTSGVTATIHYMAIGY